MRTQINVTVRGPQRHGPSSTLRAQATVARGCDWPPGRRARAGGRAKGGGDAVAALACQRPSPCQPMGRTMRPGALAASGCGIQRCHGDGPRNPSPSPLAQSSLPRTSRPSTRHWQSPIILIGSLSLQLPHSEHCRRPTPDGPYVLSSPRRPEAVSASRTLAVSAGHRRGPPCRS